MVSIKKQNYYTRRRQIDELASKLRSILPPIPKIGWTAEIRHLLGMRSKNLANRLNLTQATISDLEKNECNKSITLQSLEKLANALECDLHYVFIPKISLEEVLREKAKKVLDKEDKKISHTMALENQSSESDLRRSLKASMLITDLDKRLWEDDE